MTDTELELRKNDGTETFVLRATNVKNQISNNIVIRSILSAVGGLAGANPVLAKESFVIEFDIVNVEAADYPNSGVYAGNTPNEHNYGMKEELRRATKNWGPTFADGLDQLYYDGLLIDAEIADLQINEDRTTDPTREYTGCTLEMAHYTVNIG